MIDKKSVIYGDKIKVPQVRLVWNDKAEVMQTENMFAIAKELNKIPIVVSISQDEYIVKLFNSITDYLYGLKIAEEKKIKGSHKTKVKELKLSLTTAEFDLQRLAKQAIGHIDDNNLVLFRIVLRFKQTQKPGVEEEAKAKLNFLMNSLKEKAVPENPNKIFDIQNKSISLLIKKIPSK